MDAKLPDDKLAAPHKNARSTPKAKNTSTVSVCLSLSFLVWIIWSLMPRQLNIANLDKGQSGWEVIVENKKRELASKIPEEWRLSPNIILEAKGQPTIAGDFFDQLLDSETLQITQMDPVDIVAKTSQGELTALSVVTAFCKRAAYAHQILPTLLEIGFEQALERAKELDRHFAIHRTPVGPLHGLPFTLKDQFHVKGLETSFGYVGWIGTFEGQKGTKKERNVESELVREFNSLGAIPIAKTTLMTSTWAAETNNNILGYLNNSFKQKLSSGGSSGGEGVIQALRGSAFGVGTDSGGSVSMPASYNNIYSLKPSPGRLSLKDAAGSSRGNLVLGAVAGLMGPSIRTLRLVFMSLMETKPWLHDPFMLPLPYRTEHEITSPSDVVLGILHSDGYVAPHPPISRALRTVSAALSAKGIKVTDWHPPPHNESSQLHGPLARGDGCFDVWNAIQLSGEPIPPQLNDELDDGKPKKPRTLPQYENITLHMIDFRNRYNDYWQSTADQTGTDIGRPVDAVIMPVSPYAGFLPDNFLHETYASIINVLGYCCAAIPVTFADKEQDVVDAEYQALSDKDMENMQTYDAEACHGAPAGVQVVGRALEEEKLLSVSAIIVDALEEYRHRM